MTNINKVIDSIIILCFGCFYLLYNTTYPIDQLNNPGPGIFPFVVGSILVILVIYQLIKTLKEPPSKRKLKDSFFNFKFIKGLLTEGQKPKPFFLGIGLALYIFIIKWIGFYISTFFFVIFSSRLMGAEDLKKPTVLAMGINIFCYLLFNVILKLSFPRGILF